jgi:hypothetical protein
MLGVFAMSIHAYAAKSNNYDLVGMATANAIPQQTSSSQPRIVPVALLVLASAALFLTPTVCGAQQRTSSNIIDQEGALMKKL